MAGRSWHETAKALETITPICTAHDADGIDIYFLNHPDNSTYKNVRSASTVTEILQTVPARVIEAFLCLWPDSRGKYLARNSVSGPHILSLDPWYTRSFAVANWQAI